MLITCKCLNVAINTKTPDVQNIDVSNLDLSASEQNDQFFKENIGTVELERISEEQASLVQVRIVGNWIIHSCLNCLTNTHAIRENGAGFLLINQSLLMDPNDIAALKKSEKYSTVFRILINHGDNEVSTAHTPTKFSVSQMPHPALSALHQQLGEMIQNEAARTEERVRLYSEQQCAALEEFSQHAHRDHRALARLLCKSQEKLQPPSGLTTSPTAPVSSSLPGSPLTSPLQRSPIKQSSNPAILTPILRQRMAPASVPGESKLDNRSAPPSAGVTRQRLQAARTAQRNTKPGSLDTEGLFDLEGMEDTPPDICQSDDETDTDDSGSHDEGIHIPRARGHYSLAKSLPVSVPAYLPASRRGGEERDIERHAHEPMDIAASIKALAKSVHGDANVFGDLPRPRFSTQI